MMSNLNSRFSFDIDGQDNAKIKVVGVGGGGGNAVNNMIHKGLTSVEYIALNTDAQALKNSMADITIQVGANLTNGLGAGARPEIGREAVEENRHEIEEAIEGADMVFVTAGMGGGTGTGGAPVVSGIAKRKGILTVGIVTTPFDCEGPKRMKYALEGITELKKNSDTVIVIPNEQLMEIANEDTTLLEAFDQANQVLYNATRGISDLILMPGLINLDFADVRTTMLDGGAAIMGSASSTGEDRAEIAAREAINSPLLDGVSIRGARNVLVNISSGANLGMRETTTATSIIQQEAGEDAEIILGTVLDESFEDELRVTVIATGFDLAESNNEARVAPNSKPDKKQKSNDMEMPSAKDMTGQTKHSATNDPFYKGEKNLKHMDQPAFHRRGLKNVRSLDNDDENDQNQEMQDEQKQGDELLNNRRERIDKSDSDQPAFLRKIMD
ncbi:cell division protein FtsZ [Aliifodinibius halophilus]|uniref:Cell division protein FtsZ n=2 Tax=Fodinibius halophilus TaxID=1736908 RepID=A0A6M1T7N9_9BACT|nr:cell division protein FtsZ [Fodinibius halophilus]